MYLSPLTFPCILEIPAWIWIPEQYFGFFEKEHVLNEQIYTSSQSVLWNWEMGEYEKKKKAEFWEKENKCFYVFFRETNLLYLFTYSVYVYFPLSISFECQTLLGVRHNSKYQVTETGYRPGSESKPLAAIVRADIASLNQLVISTSNVIPSH